MIDKKISQLDTATVPLTGAELIPLVQSGNNKKIDATAFTTSMLSQGKAMTININGDIIANQLTVDQILTSTDTVPTITSTSNLNISVAGRVDITAGALTLGRFSNTTRNAIPVVDGTLIYNTTDNTTQIYANGEWITLSLPQPGATTITTTGTLTPNIDTAKQFNITALAENLTILAPTGTPRDGQTLIIRIQDNGTSRTITWTGYTAIGVALPTQTAAGKVTYVGCIYNNGSFARWDIIAVKTEV